MTNRLTFISAACSVGLCLAGAATAQDAPTISLANGTDHVFTSITVYDLVGNESLGGIVDPLRPGQSVTIPLSLAVCMPITIQAVYDGRKLIEASADACDAAIYTLTE